jgi:uncharacterized membrane protein
MIQSQSRPSLRRPRWQVVAVAWLNSRIDGFPLPRARNVVYGATGIWGVGFASASLVWYSTFGDRRYDLGNFTQAIWTTAHGHFLEVTEVGGAQVSRLGIHVDPVIAAFAPLWWVWPSPKLLLVVQALALAAGAIPLFWLAAKHLPTERSAAFVAVAYLLCPSLGWNALFEFHGVALSVPLLLFSIWFLDENRMWAFTISAVAAMLCQEQVGFLVACLGIWWGFRTRRFGVGVFVFSVGLLVSALDFAVVLRHFSGGSPYSGRFASAGGSIEGIVRNLFTDPTRLLGTFQLMDLIGAVAIVLPVLGVCLASGLTFAALPQALMLTLSDNHADWRWTAQNVLPLLPFVYAGTVFALARRSGRQRRAITSSHVFGAALLVAMLIGPLYPSGIGAHVRSSPHREAQRHAVGLVPKNARVSVTNHLGSQLSARRYVYMFPNVDRANWIVVDTADDFLPDVGFLGRRNGIEVRAHDLYWQPLLMQRAVRSLKQSSAWRQVYAASTIRVFTRR